VTGALARLFVFELSSDDGGPAELGLEGDEP
jgi:hypothetical protein